MRLPFRITRRRLIAGTASAAAAAVGLGVYTGWVEPHWIEVTRRDLPIERLPTSLQGKRLVQISDLHVGPVVDDDYLVAALHDVSRLEPDILVLTGDFMTYFGSAQIDQVARVLEHLPAARLATVGVLGNHDYGRGYREEVVAERLARRIGDAGVQLLRNATVDVAGLRIGGVDDLWTPWFQAERVVSQLRAAPASLMLCHNPDAADLPVWRGYRGWMLCGHTHGGQCKPPLLRPPLLPVMNKQYVAGEIHLAHGRRLYINRGLGHLLRVRFNARPEITVFRLQPASRA